MRRRIEVYLDGPKVSLATFLDAAMSLQVIVREVGRSLYGPDKRIEWVIDELQMSSTRLAAIPDLEGENDLDVEAIDRTLVETHGGLEQLKQSASIPRHFTDAALAAARKMSSVNSASRFEVVLGESRLEVTKHIEANIEEVTKAKLKSIGSIEGRIESVSIHQRKRFQLYDRRTGKAVECRFGFDEHKIFEGPWNKRVLVRGVIWSRADGRPLRIEVSKPDDIYEFPSDEELPSADDVRGILDSSYGEQGHG